MSEQNSVATATYPSPYSPEHRKIKPIKVTHLLHTMGYGGIETVLINWLRYVDKSRVDVQMVIFANPGATEEPFVQAAQKHGISVKKIPWSRRKPIFKAAKKLVPYLKEHGTQILHTHNTYADVVGYVARRSCNVKLVATIYVWTGQDFGFKRNMLQAISAFVIKRFDKLTVQCEKARQESVDWGFTLDSVTVLPSGYEIPPAIELSDEERRRLRAERGATDNEIVVCNVARLYPEKGQSRMLKIWQRVAQASPQARLWIYGIGPLEEELKALCRELKIEDSVSFVGFANELMKELKLCDVQLHPSFNEGVPIAICAGMASPLPIVATAVGGIPEVIVDGQSGFLLDSDDEAGIEKRTIELIQDAELRRRLSNESLRFIEEEYSMQAAVRILAETYETLTA